MGATCVVAPRIPARTDSRERRTSQRPSQSRELITPYTTTTNSKTTFICIIINIYVHTPPRFVVGTCSGIEMLVNRSPVTAERSRLAPASRDHSMPAVARPSLQPPPTTRVLQQHA
jgi:hypothetical protein